TARASRSRYGNQRQHRLAGFTHAAVILHAPAVGEQKITPFCGVHGAAAAQANNSIWASFFRDGEAVIHALGARVLECLVEESDLEARLLQIAAHMIGVSSRDNARIGDEQNLFCADFARKFTKLLDAIHAEDETRAWFVIERTQSLRAWRSWLMTHSQISDELISSRVQRRVSANISCFTLLVSAVRSMARR